MKKLFTILFILITSIVHTQNITKYSTIIKDDINSDKIPVPMHLKAGSCGSPDGSMNPTIITPPNYTWLQTNGYCNPNTYGFTPTVCWSFTPTSSSVTINSGFSYNCANATFSNFILYDASCSVIGTGLNFTGLTPGNTYTWCMDGNTWNSWIDNLLNGPCTGFSDFCPYFFNNSTLPVELVDFDGSNNEGVNNIYWVTATEINNDYFELQKSEDGYNYIHLTTIKGSGNSNTPIIYEHRDDKPFNDITYYRLKQVDFDGQFEYHNIIAIKTIDNSNNFDAIIYPNPNSGSFEIGDMDLNDIRNIIIVNSIGEVIYQSEKYTGQINIEDKPNGIYIINIYTNGGTIHRRIIKR